jgi:hypothetical protein
VILEKYGGGGDVPKLTDEKKQKKKQLKRFDK